MQQPILTKVILSRDVVWSCLSHALTTEHQEIMGLLLGYVNCSELFITRSLVLSRKDRQKDRVEVGDEIVALSSTVAERICAIDGREENVIGWYHSHPHITVMPSHVDVKTQGNYQQLDSAFVGLIFSVFDSGRFDICAFQSKQLGQDWARIEVPIVLAHSLLSPFVPTPALDSVAGLQLVALNEEIDALTAHRARAKERPSALEQCRLACTYQSALLRLMDQQLLPTLLSLRSRRRSLEYKLAKLRMLQAYRKPGVDSSPTDTSARQEIESGADVAQENILHVLESLAPEWAQRAACIELAFGGFLVRGLRLETVCGTPRAPPPPSAAYVLQLLPAPPSLSTPPSPWCVSLKPASDGTDLPLTAASSDLGCLFWLLSVPTAGGDGDSNLSVDPNHHQEEEPDSHFTLQICAWDGYPYDPATPLPPPTPKEVMTLHVNVVCGRAKEGASSHNASRSRNSTCSNHQPQHISSAKAIVVLLNSFLQKSLQLDIFNSSL
jgi:BRCA1/BRCA2-containing complex subunit 3